MISKISDLKVGMTVITRNYGKAIVSEIYEKGLKLKDLDKKPNLCPYFFEWEIEWQKTNELNQNNNKMKEKEQSSIDIIIETLKKLYLYNFSIKAVCEQAKERHKKEIIEAYNQGYREGEVDNSLMMNYKDVSDYDNGINYYKEKYSTE